MRKITLGMVVLMALTIIAGCKDTAKDKNIVVDNTSLEDENRGDSTIYGTLVDGGMNSMLLLTDEGDTLELLRNPDDTTDVVKGGIVPNDRYAVIAYTSYGERFIRTAIDIESLKGSWSSLDRNFEIEDGGAVKSALASETNAWKTWKIYNGQLVFDRDTFIVDELGADSMLLESRDGIYSFKRAKK